MVFSVVVDHNPQCASLCSLLPLLPINPFHTQPHMNAMCWLLAFSVATEPVSSTRVVQLCQNGRFAATLSMAKMTLKCPPTRNCDACAKSSIAVLWELFVSSPGDGKSGHTTQTTWPTNAMAAQIDQGQLAVESFNFFVVEAAEFLVEQ